MPKVLMKWCLDNGITSQVSSICTSQQLSSALKAALESNVISPMGAIDDSSFEILLAEDNHVNQRIALKFLEKYGHKVEIAENGAIAVDMYKQRCADHRSFDIVLMDVSMPIMGGMEATELIRKYENSLNLERTPIIALTAHAMIGDRERCLRAGMDDHITKPLHREILTNSITKLVTEKIRRRYLVPNPNSRIQYRHPHP